MASIRLLFVGLCSILPRLIGVDETGFQASGIDSHWRAVNPRFAESVGVGAGEVQPDGAIALAKRQHLFGSQMKFVFEAQRRLGADGALNPESSGERDSPSI